MSSKVAIITGASGGIGLACAEKFNKEGYFVIGIDVQKIQIPPDYKKIFIDFCIDDVSSSQMWQYVAKKYNRVDCIVNNAAITCSKSIEQIDEKEWKRVQEVNVESIFLSTKYLLQNLKNTKGCITNISSVHAIATSLNVAAYATSKGASTALIRQIAVELGKYGIRANSIIPGAVDTNMLIDGLKRTQYANDLEKAKKNIANRTPLRKLCQANDIAEAVYFISNPETANTITGASLVVDSGALAQLSTE